ncbi:hypothetical protein [Microvirga makkahensis]|uniref:Uncharacterized protein n=1 Tax=Microvirga makkahensis TaxID=1128670 RepID=A0A7X3SMM4_9HYPH|nr:hypothetical protein [Microvirga makkahensis]MXQ10446.1 hypothetical protein [Microvirga makkahensis]
MALGGTDIADDAIRQGAGEWAQALKKAAREAIEQAHSTGVPAYAEPANPAGINREISDGSHQRIEIGPGRQEAAQTD